MDDDYTITNQELREWVYWTIQSKLLGYLVEDILEVAEPLFTWVKGKGDTDSIELRQRALAAAVAPYEEIEAVSVIEDAESLINWINQP